MQGHSCCANYCTGIPNAKLSNALMGCRCALKWRQRFESSYAVTPAQLALFDKGWCAKCLGICACKRCLTKPSPAVGGAAPVFAKSQEKAFALHTLAVLQPHIDEFLAARDAEVQPLVLHGKCLQCVHTHACSHLCTSSYCQSVTPVPPWMHATLPAFTNLFAHQLLPLSYPINSHLLICSLSCYFAIVLTNSCMVTCPIAQPQTYTVIHLCLGSKSQSELSFAAEVFSDTLLCFHTSRPDYLKKGVDMQVAVGNDGQPVDLKSLPRVPLTDRMQCDCCAACITDVHRTCTKCGGYDACIRCCHAVRTEDKVRQPFKPMSVIPSACCHAIHDCRIKQAYSEICCSSF